MFTVCSNLQFQMFDRHVWNRLRSGSVGEVLSGQTVRTSVRIQSMRLRACGSAPGS